MSIKKYLVVHCVKSVQILILFWSVFSCIWTEYEDLRSKSMYLVRIQENTNQKKLRIWTFFMQWLGNNMQLNWRYFEFSALIKLTLRMPRKKIHLKIKLKRLQKVWICGILETHTLNQLFIWGFYIEIKFSKKLSSWRQICVLCDGSIFYNHSICLNIGFRQNSFV